MISETSQSNGTAGPAERLLLAADRLFYEQGYAATGINELLKVAGVAKASFYYHFASKTDLVVAYLDQRQAAVFEKVVEVVDRHQSPDRRVLALFDFLTEWLQATDFRGCAFLNTIPEFADTSSAPRVKVRAAKKGIRDFVAKLCTEAGIGDAGDEVFLLVEGATAQAAVVSDLWPVEAARRAVRRRLQTPAIES